MSSSVGMIIPNIWKNKECSKPPNIAIENGPVEIVELPSKNGDFPVRKLLVYQRVTNQIASVPQNHHQVGPHLASPSQDTAPVSALVARMPQVTKKGTASAKACGSTLRT